MKVDAKLVHFFQICKFLGEKYAGIGRFRQKYADLGKNRQI
jgi:hypothetical protein